MKTINLKNLFLFFYLISTPLIAISSNNEDNDLIKEIIDKSVAAKNNNVNNYINLDEYISNARISRQEQEDENIFTNSSDFGSLLLTSNSAIIKDLKTGKILYQKNSDIARPIASISKLMSAMVLLDANLDMNTKIQITEDDVDKVKKSSSRLRVGTVLTRRELLHIGLMSSENRAIHALARTYPGGMSNFVRNMNAKARSLGMYETIFYEPTGLNPNNRSTAKDLLVLADAANKYPAIRNFSTSNYGEVFVAGRIQRYRNTNALVRDGIWDIKLQKTGYIREAGRCMIVTANIQNRPIVMVLLGAPSGTARTNDAIRSEEWLTQNY